MLVGAGSDTTATELDFIRLYWAQESVGDGSMGWFHKMQGDTTLLSGFRAQGGKDQRSMSDFKAS
jgi:hypothetical protein